MALPISKVELDENYLDYTWLISGVLYEGGTDLLIPELMKKGITEVYFYNGTQDLFLGLRRPRNLNW